MFPPQKYSPGRVYPKAEQISIASCPDCMALNHVARLTFVIGFQTDSMCHQSLSTVTQRSALVYIYLLQVCPLIQ